MGLPKEDYWWYRDLRPEPQRPYQAKKSWASMVLGVLAHFLKAFEATRNVSSGKHMSFISFIVFCFTQSSS